jgi:hypothetical protein
VSPADSLDGVVDSSGAGGIVVDTFVVLAE